MKYCITIERTQRIAVWFDAEDDEAAEEKAGEIYNTTQDHPHEFESGDTEYDYALDREDGGTILDWD